MLTKTNFKNKPICLKLSPKVEWCTGEVANGSSTGRAGHLGTRPRDCGYRGDPGLEMPYGEVGVLDFLPVLGRLWDKP